MPAANEIPYDLLRARERSACEWFVRAHYEGVYRWLCRLTGCSDVAEDLTQESFTAFWSSVERTTPGVSPRVWLYSVARNQWRKHCRNLGASRERSGVELDELRAPQVSPAAAEEYREFVAAVEAAMAELTPELREVFSLRVWHEFDHSQIAAIQEISADLVRWRFHRARTHVRDRLRAWTCVQEKSHDD